jgi:ribosomal protein L11 methyltransferase
MTELVQLSFELESLDPGVAEEACFALGAGSVTFEDSRDDPVLEPLPGEFRLWPSPRVRALFESCADAQEVRGRLAMSLGLELSRVTAQVVQPRIWEREWLKDFHARRFGRRLWISPRHEEVHEPGAVVVRLDPGMAFGTGTHPTTALCLEWLDAHLAEGATVIDYGCGSGVLAVAALALGARACTAFDIDPQALIATRENAQVNGVEARLRVSPCPQELPLGVDILMANILSGPLIELASSFRERVAPGGQVVLAGLLDEEASHVTRAYAPWFDMLTFGRRDGWIALMGRRREDAQPERGARST